MTSLTKTVKGVLLTIAISCFPLLLLSQTPPVVTRMGKGIQFTSPDSSLFTKFSFRSQNLLMTEAPLVGDADWKTTFLIRRFRLKFDGWAFSPKVIYKLQLGFSNRDLSASDDFNEVKKGSRIVLDAVVKWKATKKWTILFGKTKLPGNREGLISSQKLQLVDRSLLNSRYTFGRDIGIQLHGSYKVGKMIARPKLSWATGEGRNITVGNINGFSYIGALELLPMGLFTKNGNYFGGDLARESKPKLAIQGTFEHNAGAVRQRGQLGKFLVDSTGAYVSADLNTFFADFIFKYRTFGYM